MSDPATRATEIEARDSHSVSTAQNVRDILERELIDDAEADGFGGAWWELGECGGETGSPWGEVGEVFDALEVVGVGDGWVDAELAAGASVDALAAGVGAELATPDPEQPSRDRQPAIAVAVTGDERGSERLGREVGCGLGAAGASGEPDEHVAGVASVELAEDLGVVIGAGEELGVARRHVLVHVGFTCASGRPFRAHRVRRSSPRCSRTGRSRRRWRGPRGARCFRWRRCRTGRARWSGSGTPGTS